VVDLRHEYPGLPDKLIRHCARLYGTRVRELLGPARTCVDLGRHFGDDFYEREARYLRETE
jgi:glycerol-3-phosphate dehydrogenase